MSAAYPDADLTKACEDLPHVNEADAKVFESLAQSNEEAAKCYAGLTKATEDSSNINVSGVNAIAALAQVFAGLSKNNGSGKNVQVSQDGFSPEKNTPYCKACTGYCRKVKSEGGEMTVDDCVWLMAENKNNRQSSTAILSAG